ncbi:hypothetical protein BGW42_003886 [Actinomortierella wolfii]|nr:hypothetical protein BGW42_003886 [Actinomortierella wolfii]
MDYALPHIVKLPRLTPLSATPVTPARTVPEPTPSEADTVSLGCRDDEDLDIDMLNDDDDDDDDLDDMDYDLLSELSSPMASLTVSSPSPTTTTATTAMTLSDTGSEEEERLTMPLDSSASSLSSSTLSMAEMRTTVRRTSARLKIKAGVRERQEMQDRSNLTLTKNGATTLKSTRDARVDFFFAVHQSNPSGGSGSGSGNDANGKKGGLKPTTAIQTLVRQSWKVSPLDTLRLIFHLRSVRNGKGERAAFYACLDFLRNEHPKTLLYNLRFIPDHGYWKDLLNWVVFECRRSHDGGVGGSAVAAGGNVASGHGHKGQGNTSSKDARARDLEYRATTALKMEKSETHRKIRGSHRRRRSMMMMMKHSQGGHVHTKQLEQQSWMALDRPSRQLAEHAILNSASARERAQAQRERAAANQRQFEQRQRELSKKARLQRRRVMRERLDHACLQFEHNAFYRTLHIEVARLFARALKRDKAKLLEAAAAAAASTPQLSLAGKWCPSLNQFHDKHTLISTTIAQILFPDWLPGETEPAYIHRVRQALRTEYYVPLRKALLVLEPFMTSYRWDEIDYSRVPANAMKTNKVLFEKYDGKRFQAYLKSVEQGQLNPAQDSQEKTETIAAASLMPHQMVHEVLRHHQKQQQQQQQQQKMQKKQNKRNNNNKNDSRHLDMEWSRPQSIDIGRDSSMALETTELQWRAYVERLKKRIGNGCLFKSCMAMCDISESMKGTPLEAAIGLSLLLAELTEPPFNGHVMSFAEQPFLHKLDPNASFASRVMSVVRMSAGLNTDLFRAFTVLLNKAVEAKLPPDQMVKTLFIFSDMEFDQAIVGGVTTSGGGRGGMSGKRNKSMAGRQKKAAFTNYHNIQVLYRRKGYELPRIVFWNLSPSAGNGNMPVLATTGDTALVSGFSGMMMKTFLQGGEDLMYDMDPVRIMEAAISGPEFSKLKVLD